MQFRPEETSTRRCTDNNSRIIPCHALYQHCSLRSIMCERILDAFSRAGALLLPFNPIIQRILRLVVLSNHRSERHPRCSRRCSRRAEAASQRRRSGAPHGPPQTSLCSLPQCTGLAGTNLQTAELHDTRASHVRVDPLSCAAAGRAPRVPDARDHARARSALRAGCPVGVQSRIVRR